MHTIKHPHTKIIRNIWSSYLNVFQHCSWLKCQWWKRNFVTQIVTWSTSLPPAARNDQWTLRERLLPFQMDPKLSGWFKSRTRHSVRDLWVHSMSRRCTREESSHRPWNRDRGTSSWEASIYTITWIYLRNRWSDQSASEIERFTIWKCYNSKYEARTGLCQGHSEELHRGHSVNECDIKRRRQRYALQVNDDQRARKQLFEERDELYCLLMAGALYWIPASATRWTGLVSYIVLLFRRSLQITKASLTISYV